jgi:penicillin-binding protein 2
LASNIKPFIALQLLNTGTITPTTSVYDPGWFKLPNTDHVYWDWVHTGHGSVKVSRAITESCDTFFYNMATKLGIEKIGQILTSFGFGKKTGIDFTEEQQGIVASPEWKMRHTGKPWYYGDTVISIIGQGFMSTTPLQLAHAVSIIAERGIGFKPHLLGKSIDPDGKVTTQQPTPDKPIILSNNKFWDIVINAMEQVISGPAGTARGRFGTNFPYTVAGKTGGAQLYHHKYNNEGATPEDEAAIPKKLRNHSLFIAFAPIKNPQIAIAVIVENSNDAPKVARRVLDYYLLPKDQQQKIITEQPAAKKATEENDSDEEEDITNNEDSNNYDEEDYVVQNDASGTQTDDKETNDKQPEELF